MRTPPPAVGCFINFGMKHFIGSRMPAKSLELQHGIRLIRELDAEIEENEAAIQSIMDELNSPISTIPGIGYRMGAMILAEAGDFSRFDSSDKLLAYAEMPPSTYQSGQLKNCYPHMEKRGSRYLRYALYHVYSMDYTPAIENHATSLVLSPEELLIRGEDETAEKLVLANLAAEIAQLSPIQARRLHARYALKKKYREIAADEGVTGSCAAKSGTSAVTKLSHLGQVRTYTPFRCRAPCRGLLRP